MRFERTFDMTLVREIMTHPKVYPFITDDFSPPVEQFAPLDHPLFWYMLAFDGEELLGMWLFEQRGVAFQVHTCLLPGYRFQRGRQAAREMAEWIWTNSGCQRIWTAVPRNNRIAVEFARAAGMTQFGVNERSFLKNGILQDQILLGMSRPEN